MKKNYMFNVFTIFFIVMTISFICGCSDYKADLKKKIKTSYPEWMDYLEPSFDGVKITSYSEENGNIYMEVEDNSVADSYAELIMLHNKFVEDNPTYFSGTKIEVVKRCGGAQRMAFSSSIYDSYNILSDYEGDRKSLELNEDGKLIYVWILYSEIDYLENTKNKDFLSDVGLLDMQVGTNIYNRDRPEEWKFLDDFSNLEKIVIETTWEFDSNEEYYRTIKQAKPGLDIITAEYGKNLY